LSGEIQNSQSVSATATAQDICEFRPDDRALVAAAVDHVVIGAGSVDVHLNQCLVAGGETETISIPWVKPSSRGRRQVIEPLSGGVDQRVIRADTQTALIDTIVRARRWLDEIASGKVESFDEIAEQEGRTGRSIRMTLSLAFLAPSIVRAIVEGTIPRGVGLSRLADLPPSWIEQLAQLGLDRSTHA
jgi:hypothetical protein